MAIKITPMQLAQQWATLPNKFEVNVLNFEVVMGMLAVDIFRKSFYLKRFNAPGSPAWEPRKRAYKHPMMEETGSLKRSISYKRFKTASSHGVRIYTDPRVLQHAKRQEGSFYPKYARAHNDGAPDINLPKRQFIGHSAYIADKLRSNSIRLFSGFPI